MVEVKREVDAHDGHCAYSAYLEGLLFNILERIARARTLLSSDWLELDHLLLI